MTVHEQMIALESRIEQIDQNARSITGTLTALSAAVERHEKTRDVLDRLVEASEAIEPQLQVQQTQLDEIAQSSTNVEHDLQGGATGFLAPDRRGRNPTPKPGWKPAKAGRTCKNSKTG